MPGVNVIDARGGGQRVGQYNNNNRCISSIDLLRLLRRFKIRVRKGTVCRSSTLCWLCDARLKSETLAAIIEQVNSNGLSSICRGSVSRWGGGGGGGW